MSATKLVVNQEFIRALNNLVAQYAPQLPLLAVEHCYIHLGAGSGSSGIYVEYTYNPATQAFAESNP